MIPKLTDDAVARLPLSGGRTDLLAEILRDTEVAGPRSPRRPRPPRRSHRVLAPLAAAAVVAGLAGGTLWWQQQRPDPGQQLTAAAALGLQEGQQVVLDAPGWRADSLGGDGMVFGKGRMRLEITSYPEDLYDSYVLDREHIEEERAAGRPVQVLGRPALMWAYAPTDHTTIREVQNGRWLEIRAEGMGEAAYLALLDSLRVVSTEEFEAALPDDFVTAAEREQAVRDVLDGIRAQSGAGLPRDEPLVVRGADDEALDPYQFGAQVAGAYACAWLVELENATSHDQAAAAAEAARVLATSPSWPVLQEMDAAGDYPEVVWEYADQAAAGQVPEGFREGLGCP